MLQKLQQLFNKVLCFVKNSSKINAIKLISTKSKLKFSKSIYYIIGASLVIFLSIFFLVHTRATSTIAVNNTNNNVTISPKLSTTAPALNTPSNHNTKAVSTIPQLVEKTVVVRKKDSLNKMFKRLAINPEDAKDILKLNKTKALRNLRSGQKLTFYFMNNKLNRITLPIDVTDTLVINKNNNRFQSYINHIEPIERTKCAHLTINRSIYASAKKANVPSTMVAEFVTALKNKVNIAKVLRNGDKVAFLYKDYYVNGKKINKTSKLVAAEYTHNKKTYKIVKFVDNSGHSTFYTADGYSLVSPFVRYPLKFKRITSPFSLNRFNPVSHVYRKHTGVDLAANIGTPIKATSNGVVTFAGRKGSYGNVAIIKHNQFSTLYAHMMKFAKGVHVGSAVRQGQVIGYVGMTGRTDGPHVHYEFQINNIPYDPLKVKLPDGEMIAKNYRAQFFRQKKILLAQLDSFKFASAEQKNDSIQRISSPAKKNYKI